MLNSLRIFNRVYQKIQLNSYRACIIQANNTFINMYYTLLLANQVIPTAEKQVNNSYLSCCWLTSLWTYERETDNSRITPSSSSLCMHILYSTRYRSQFRVLLKGRPRFFCVWCGAQHLSRLPLFYLLSTVFAFWISNIYYWKWSCQ